MNADIKRKLFKNGSTEIKCRGFSFPRMKASTCRNSSIFIASAH